MIEHVALWTKDLEESKNFFMQFFGGMPGEKYMAAETNFQSYFMTFDRGPRLEIMHLPDEPEAASADERYTGYSHIAFSVGSREAVDDLTEKLRKQNYKVVSEPRFTGDGYYESCILDRDNHRIEITI